MPMDHPLGESMLRSEADDDDMPPLVEAPGSTAIVPYSYTSNYASRTNVGFMNFGKPVPAGHNDDDNPPDLVPPPLFDPEEPLAPSSLSLYPVSGADSLPSSPSFVHTSASTMTSFDSMQMNSFQDARDVTSQDSSTGLIGPVRSSQTRKHSARPASYIPRPPNAFILFRSSFVRAQRIPGRVEGNHSTLSKIAGMYWKNMRKEEREQWERRAMEKLEEHRKRYPDWRFRPGNTSGLKLKDGGGGGSGAGPGSGTATGSSKSSSQSSSNLGGQVKRRKRALTTATMSSAHPDTVALDTLRQKRCEKIVDLLEEGVVGTELAARVDEYDRDVALSGGYSSLNSTAPLMTTLNIEVQTSQMRAEHPLTSNRDSSDLTSHQLQGVKREEQGHILIVETSPTPTSPYAPPSPFIQTSLPPPPSLSRTTDVRDHSISLEARMEEPRNDASAGQKGTDNADVSDSGNRFTLPSIPLTAIAKRSSSAPAAPGRVPVLGLASLEFNFPETGQVNVLPQFEPETTTSVEQVNVFLPSVTQNISDELERRDQIHTSTLGMAQTTAPANENVGNQIGVVPLQSPVVQAPLLSSYSTLEGWAGPPQSTVFPQSHNSQSPFSPNARDSRPLEAVPLSGSYAPTSQYSAGQSGLQYYYSTSNNTSYGHGYYTVNSTSGQRQGAPAYAFEDYPASGTNVAEDRRGSISSNSSSGSIFDQGA